ncbi:MAG: YHS domain-containing (seleno)protein [Planctomycetota bacterium]
MKRSRQLVLFTVAATIVGITAYANFRTAGFEVTQSQSGRLLLLDENQTAIDGYDPVAYFTEGRATKGTDAFTATVDGAKWKFSTNENRQAFLKNPDQYIPAYGGYCAWAVAAKADLFDGDPEHWKVVDGKLYLNFNADVQSQWLEDTDGFIRDGDQNWPKIVADRAE